MNRIRSMWAQALDVEIEPSPDFSDRYDIVLRWTRGDDDPIVALTPGQARNLCEDLEHALRLAR